jgi:hypothetical protein
MNALGRRITGVILGTGMGLLYAILSQYINVIVLPGIPLFETSPGRLSATLLSTLGGAALGLIAAWPASVLAGVAFSGLAGALGVVIGSFLNTTGSQGMVASLAFNLFYIFIPMIVMFMPIGALIRWGINTLTIHNDGSDAPAWQKIAIVGGILVAAGVVGSLGLYSPEEQNGLRAINTVILSGVIAQAREELPDSLRSVNGFVENASEVYSLEVTDETDLYQGPIPEASNEMSRVTVLVRFQNGFSFVCIDGRGIDEPLCRNL